MQQVKKAAQDCPVISSFQGGDEHFIRQRIED
jgi:hypothetical protein